MSGHEKPTPAERAADLEHDPRTCHICLRPEIYGDNAEDEETRELFRLRDSIEEYRREVERRDEYLRGADDEILGLKGQLAHFAVRLESAEGTLNRHGFRRCDLPACNCGWWHAPEVKR